MKEIDDIYLGGINNGAHYLFLSNVTTRAEGDTHVKEKAGAQVNALRTCLTQEDADLKLSQKSMLSDEITKEDQVRDSLYRGYKKTVQGFLNLPVEEMANAAKVLNQHIKDYKIDPKMQLDRETGMLINFIADLESTYKKEVDILSLNAFVTNLKQSNERLHALTLQRTDERMTIPLGALKKSRKASDEAYRMLVKMVNALAMVEGDANYANFIDYVNTEITHYKREVLGQKAPAPKDETPETPDETPETPDTGGDSESPDEI